MSRDFATGGYQGDLGVGNEVTAYPVTFGCWVKTHPELTKLVQSFGATWGQRDQSHYVESDNAVQYRWFGNSRNTVNDLCVPVYNPNGAWTPILYVCRAADDRQLYVGNQSNQDTTSTATLASSLRYLGLGTNAFTVNWVGLMAEFAWWSSALSAGDVTAFLGGTNPSTISNANQIAYYSLKESTGHLTDESGNAGPTLTVHETQPTWSVEHPTFLASTRVTASLKELDGVTNLPTSLLDVRWAWFDTEPGTAQSVPVDYGTGLLISSGVLDVDLPNTTLTIGQFGYLVLEHQASGRRQAYRLQVTENA